MTDVIYARYSTDNQREESIEGQLRECKAFAEKNGIQIIDTYIDRAMSAKTDNRPDFQKMIKDSAKQQFETVIVWKLDRFARNRYDSAHYKSILKRNNVRVLSATEAISQGAEGIILESVLEGMAEYYSAELAEKVIRGQTENALSCRFNGGTVPVGYNIVNQHFVVNNEVAPLVLSAYEMYDDGKTMQEIADDLNVKGLRNTRGTKLTINTVSNLLTNRRYIGEYSYRDILVPDGIPAIVPKDLFNRVQERIAKNKKSPARHRADEEYILSTKLYCGKCMTFMVGESGTARNKETYRYYKCLSAKRKRGCDKKAVKKKWIEDIVIDQILECIWDDNLIEDVTDLVMKMQRQENTAVSLLNKRLDEVNESISNILSAIEQGIITPSTKQRLEELEGQKKEFEIEIAKENITRLTLDRDQIKFWFHRFRKVDASKPENRRRLVDSFVNSIILYDDRIEFYFNFKKGAKTLSLPDLKKGSDMLDSLPPKIPISPSGGRYFYCQRRGIYHVHAPREAAQPAAKEHAPACSFRFLPPPLPPFVSTSSTPQHSCDNPLSKPRNLLMTLLYHKKLVMSSQKSQVSCDYPLTKPKIQRSILSKAVCICRGGARRVFW